LLALLVPRKDQAAPERVEAETVAILAVEDGFYLPAAAVGLAFPPAGQALLLPRLG